MWPININKYSVSGKTLLINTMLVKPYNSDDYIFVFLKKLFLVWIMWCLTWNMTADLAIQVMLTVQIMSCCIEIIDHNSSLTMEIL